MVDSMRDELFGEPSEARDERALWGAAFEDETQDDEWEALDAEPVGAFDADDELAEPFDEDAVEESSFASELQPQGTERVRFVAPAWLKVEGERDELEGVVMNLSTRGMAVAASREMSPGERLWARFSLGLGAEPLSLLCQVLWRRASGDAAPVYGLRFVSLADEEVSAIDATVRERAEGRAAAWSLPILPEEEEPRAGRKTPSPLVTGLLGGIAGIVVGVLVAALPRVGATATTASVEPPPVVEQAAPVEVEKPLLAEPVAAPEASKPAMAQEAPKPAAPVVEPAPVEEISAPVAAAAPVVEAAPAPEAKPERQGLLPRREPATPSADSDTLRPLGSANHLELALPTDGPVDEHVAFWLESPRRLVIDILGRKSTLARTSYDVEHPLATRLRVGQHEHKVRYVLEVSDAASTEVVTRRQGDSLVVELNRR